MLLERVDKGVIQVSKIFFTFSFVQTMSIYNVNGTKARLLKRRYLKVLISKDFLSSKILNGTNSKRFEVILEV